MTKHCAYESWNTCTPFSCEIEQCNLKLDRLDKELDTAQLQLDAIPKISSKLMKEFEIIPLQNSTRTNVTCIIFLNEETLLLNASSEKRLIKFNQESLEIQVKVFDNVPFGL